MTFINGSIFLKKISVAGDRIKDCHMIDNGNDENYYFGKIAIRLKLIADGEGYQNSKVHIEEFPSQVLKAQYLIEVIRFYRKYE